MEPIFTIAEASKLIAEKKLSPVELTKDCIARMKAHDDTLHAFILPTEERALADARAAEARVMAGSAEGSVGRHPDRSQGHLQHRRHPHDRAFETAGGQRPDAGCAPRCASGPRRAPC